MSATGVCHSMNGFPDSEKVVGGSESYSCGSCWSSHFKLSSSFELLGGSAVILMSRTILVVAVGELPGQVVGHIVSEYAIEQGGYDSS
jgi:hypothetical protein